jgi:hypothetical protein
MYKSLLQSTDLNFWKQHKILVDLNQEIAIRQPNRSWRVPVTHSKFGTSELLVVTILFI